MSHADTDVGLTGGAARWILGREGNERPPELEEGHGRIPEPTRGLCRPGNGRDDGPCRQWARSHLCCLPDLSVLSPHGSHSKANLLSGQTTTKEGPSQARIPKGHFAFKTVDRCLKQSLEETRSVTHQRP